MEEKMKKIFKAFLCALFMIAGASAFAAKKSIVCVTYPEYDWVMNILGDKASKFNVSLLQKNGTDLHSYQPSVKDIASISTCDMLVYVGGESDEWVEKALSNAKNKNMIVVNMMEVLGDRVKEEEIVEGMEHHHEDAHHHDGDEHHHEEAASHHHSVAFKDSDVKNRSLSEFNGEWTSAYVYYKEGSLDSAIAFTAAQEPKTDLALLRACYDKGLKTDIDYININGSNVSFKIKGKTKEAKYAYAGYRIVSYAAGNRGVRYFFEVQGKANGCPKYIGFNDHMIAPTKPEHYHFYSSNKSIDDMCGESDNWPTYFPKNYSKDEVSKAFAGYNPMAHSSAAGHSDHHAHHHHDEDEEIEYDEHVWLSLKNAVMIVNHLSEKIQTLDSANAAAYKTNTASYVKQLSDLDREYAKTVATASRKTVLFGDRFPFRYLTEDYGLSYYAAFVGCSAESEASFETIRFLSKKVDELGLKSVLTIEKSDKKIAKTIISNTSGKNQTVLEMDSLQSVTNDDIKSGRNYLSAMKKNLEVLKKALN